MTIHNENPHDLFADTITLTYKDFAPDTLTPFKRCETIDGFIVWLDEVDILKLETGETLTLHESWHHPDGETVFI